ncbi:hypothetical protein [Nostoc sp.]
MVEMQNFISQEFLYIELKAVIDADLSLTIDDKIELHGQNTK